jgi:U3 small nucleolar RNA-associated protein 20
LTIILRDTQLEVEEKQMITLLAMIQPDLEEPERQATTFSLIRSILSRQLVVMEVYDLMDTVARVLVTNQSKQVRELCRHSYVQFILFYPHGHQRFEKQMAYLINQLDYQHESGRQSVLDLFNVIMKKFSEEVFLEYSDMIFLRLVMTLANDPSPSCREMSSVLIINLLLRLDMGRMDTPIKLLEKWLETDKPELRKIAIQIFGLIVDAFGSKAMKWAPFWMENINVALKDVAVEWKENQQEGEDASLELWEVGYYSLSTICKLLKSSPVLHSNPFIEWSLISDLLLHPHQWVRRISCQLMGSLFSHIDTKTCKFVGSAFTGLVQTHPVEMLGSENHLKRLARRFCDQLDSDIITAELSKQVVKNLFFLSKSLVAYIKDTQAEDAEEEEPTEEAEPGTGLLWLTKRLSFLARAEGAKRNRGTVLVFFD